MQWNNQCNQNAENAFESCLKTIGKRSRIMFINIHKLLTITWIMYIWFCLLQYGHIRCKINWKSIFKAGKYTQKFLANSRTLLQKNITFESYGSPYMLLVRTILFTWLSSNKSNHNLLGKVRVKVDLQLIFPIKSSS